MYLVQKTFLHAPTGERLLDYTHGPSAKFLYLADAERFVDELLEEQPFSEYVVINENTYELPSNVF